MVSLLHIVLQCFIGTTHFQKGESLFMMSREAEDMRENIASVADILKEDCRSLRKLIAEWTELPKSIVQQILHEDLWKWKLCAQFVLHTLTAKQKEQRLNHTFDLIKTIKNYPKFLYSIITGGESWYFAYNLETKRQSFKWCGRNTPPSQNFDFKNQG